MTRWNKLRESFGYAQDPRDEKGFELLHQLEKEILLADFIGEKDESIIERLKVSTTLLKKARRSPIFTFNKVRHGYRRLMLIFETLDLSEQAVIISDFLGESDETIIKRLLFSSSDDDDQSHNRVGFKWERLKELSRTESLEIGSKSFELALLALKDSRSNAYKKLKQYLPRSRAYHGSFTEEEILALMKDIGVFMATKEWDFDKRIPNSSEIVSLFYSWDRAWKLAGITRPNEQKNPFQDDDLLQTLKNRGEYVTISVWNSECKSPSSTTITTRFGGWRSAWEKAGIPVPFLPEMVAVNHSKLSDARSIAKITKKSLAEHSGVPVHIIERLESEYGSDKVEVEKLQKLAEALEVSVEDLQ